MDIVTGLKHVDDTGVGGRSAYPQFLEFLDQTGLAITGWWFGEMLFSRGSHKIMGLTFRHCRQDTPIGVLIGRVVPPFLIELEKPVEENHRARGPETGFLVAAAEVHAHFFDVGRGHLAGDGAFPYQFIEPMLVLIEMASHILRRAGRVRGADGLVGFLGVLGPGFVHAGRIGKILSAKPASDQFAAAGHGFTGKGNAVGSHVGNQTLRLAINGDAFIESLGETHGARGPEPQFSRCFLLQGGRGEGGIRIALDRLALHRGH